ncbi:MAG: hypothetical protein A2Y76_14395 [Planctomycetes bacterium RBG_13_60_9]|nr:MAG: hypothetical protein A2Y76_14395 [Planctomycetes bacterium RBG_13_60_9]
MPTVSVVIASYNHEKYVAETIQSVIDQTYQDFEIVITDDGSADGTVAEIRRFADPRIRLTCFESNCGACAAMDNCLDQAKGEYIAVLNSDDAFLPGKLDKQVRFLNDHPEIGAVFGLAQFMDEEGRRLTDTSHQYSAVFATANRSRHEWLNHFFFEGNCLCHPSVLLRRKCYETVGCYDRRLAQLPDLDFWVRLCMKYDIHIMDEELVKFRICRSNASAGTPEHLTRHWWEFRHVLDHYLGLENVDDLRRIFPDAKGLLTDRDADLIPFAVAMIALQKTGPTSFAHKSFALDTVFDLLADPERAQRVSTKCAFRYVDFLKLTGQIDAYNILRGPGSQRKPKMNPLKSAIRKLTGLGRNR